MSLDSTSSANNILRGLMDFCLFGKVTVAMIVNSSCNVPILIICLRYSSLIFPIWDVILYPTISCGDSCMMSNDDVVWSNLMMRWSTCCGD